MQGSFRGYRGMQVHAVPDSDKFVDANGRKLPWAYDVNTSAADGDSSREPIEKGPFGRSQRRSRSGLSRSRSKTAEPRREEERARLEQVASEDVVFGSLRKTNRDVRDLAVAKDEQQTLVSSVATTEEASEVILYGFGFDLEWAALDFYERVSGGCILEDYARQPQSLRFDLVRSFSRSSGQKTLSRAALKKRNTFAGGHHWIKVTFDSRAAAERACSGSPHIIKGHLVYAEPYQSRGPGKDEAILATQAGAQILDERLPITFSTDARNPVTGSPSSSTETATATGTSATLGSVSRNVRSSATSTSTLRSTVDNNPQPKTPNYHPRQRVPASTSTITSTAHPASPKFTQTPRRRRISEATSLPTLPASAAFAPRRARQPWTAWLGSPDVIGSSLPQKEDATFDFAAASLYWQIFWWIDFLLGTDFLGLKEGE